MSDTKDKAEWTAGPWRYACTGMTMAGYSQPFGVSGTGKTKGQLIAGCFGDVLGGAAQAEANARRIVHCVNTHSQLVKALERIRDRHFTDEAGDREWVEWARAEARTALSKAKGEA